MKKFLVFGLVLVILSFSGCKMLTALFGKVTVTFDLNGGQINGSTEDVKMSGDAEEDFLLPQNPFKNADKTRRYEFDGWKAAKNYSFDHESSIRADKQVATFPEEDVTYIAQWKSIW